MPLTPGKAIPNDSSAPISVGDAAGSARSLNSTLQSSNVLADRAADQHDSSIADIEDLFVEYGEAANLSIGVPFRFSEFRGAQIIKAIVTATPETPSQYGTADDGVITVTVSPASFSQLAGVRQARITIGGAESTINPDVTPTVSRATLNAGTYTVIVRDNITSHDHIIAEESVSIEVTYGGTSRSVTIIGTQRV